MRRGILFVLSLIVLVAPMMFGPSVPAAHAQEVIYHTVRSGDTLTRIAQQYGVTVNDLVRHNNITNINVLRVGQRLIIPNTGRPTATRTATSTMQTPVRTATPAPPPGATRTSPVATPTATPTPVTGGRSAPVATPTIRPTWQPLPSYTVRSGDNLTSIALRFGVTVQALMARNNLRSDTIYVGQRLIIPVD